ncbi:MAG: MobP3 family relaxase [Eubacteriales bacterium]|nr:MobP3 family relaxase [Eubacteriales bacterium]
MVRLIVKSPYIRCSGGNAGGYMKYIATRENVEKYAQYIAERPGSHGLFGGDDVVDLQKAMDELKDYTGNVWTHIVSLHREDAVRYGYDYASAWKNLIRSHRNEIAEAMHISPEHFRWYAAFHNEDHHPHIHMMAWSTDPKEAYLDRSGIRTIKSALANDIFSHEMVQLYEQKSETRQELVHAARQSMRALAQEMQSGFVDFPEQETLMRQLAGQLGSVRGKHSYGYLPKDAKQLVDKIVDNMLSVKIVSDCYDRWLVLQGKVDSYYAGENEPRQRLPLSQVKEFRAIKNAVIKVADDIRLGRVTFEDDTLRQDDEPDKALEVSPAYWQLRYEIEDGESTLAERDEAITKMQMLARQDDLHAQYYLGQLYRDGGIVIPDSKLAEYYLKSAAERGMPEAQYALGKLCLSDDEEVHDAAQGIRWLEAAAERGSNDAAYLLGKLYLPKDREKTVYYFEQAARQDNPHAQYALGKIFLAEHDTERGMAYMEQAAENGSECAWLFLNRQNSLAEPQLMLAATRLLYHMGRIFQDNSLPQTVAVQHIDRKRRQKFQAKRIAHGHKPDDHEEYQGPTMVM